jgi:protein-S-isoprenylcysteine O-methyltransferase Ste14
LSETYWFPKPYSDAVAKLRVPFGFVLLVAFALLANPTPASVAFGFPISVLGLLIRGWAAGHLSKNQDLATSGPYAFVRNPLYIGTLTAAVGIVVACRNWVLAGIFAAAFVLVYLPVIELEEQHLRAIFPRYGDYAEHVRRLLPMSHWDPIGRRFAWSLYKRNEEYQAAAGFLIAAAWILVRLWWRNRRM